jgi:hypothetical protein
MPDALIARNYRLASLSYVKVLGIDSSILVSIDGKQVRPDDRGLIAVLAGKHLLSASKIGNETIVQTMELAGGDTLKCLLNWKSLPAYLTIATVPMRAVVKIGGDSVAETPVENLPVAAGKQSVLLLNRNYVGIERTLFLEPGKVFTFSDTFTEFSKELLSWKASIRKAQRFDVVFPGLGDFVSGMPVHGLGPFVLGMASDGLCYVAGYQYFSHKALLNSATIPEEKQYYSKRISEDEDWAVVTFAISIVLRLLSYELTSNIRF